MLLQIALYELKNDVGTNRWGGVADIVKQSVGQFQQIQLLKSKDSSVCL
jgi:hypothetical protein